MRVSVVVPTYNRAEKLGRVLDSLARQIGGHDLEVLVCDDGSSDRTRTVATSYTGPLAMRYLRQPDFGFRAGQARNMGIAAAIGDIVIFIDDDSLVAPDFVDAHVRMHCDERRPCIAIGYRFRADCFVGLPASAAQIRDFGVDNRTESLGRNGALLALRRRPWLFVYSCNFSVPRRAPGLWFNGVFRGWGVEDNELGYRLIRAGYRVRFAAGAPTLHLEDPAPRDPFLCERRATAADFDSYVRNMLRFLDLHGSDPLVRRYALSELGYFTFDHAAGKWRRSTTHHDPAAVIARERARMRPWWYVDGDRRFSCTGPATRPTSAERPRARPALWRRLIGRSPPPAYAGWAD